MPECFRGAVHMDSLTTCLASSKVWAVTQFQKLSNMRTPQWDAKHVCLWDFCVLECILDRTHWPQNTFWCLGHPLRALQEVSERRFSSTINCEAYAGWRGLQTPCSQGGCLPRSQNVWYRTAFLQNLKCNFFRIPILSMLLSFRKYVGFTFTFRTVFMCNAAGSLN